MTIAWRRLADVPEDDPRPWLYATARNLLLAESRKVATERRHRHELAAPETRTNRLRARPAARAALNEFSPLDREVSPTAWEEPTPTRRPARWHQADGVPRRLLRARRRVEAKLAEIATAPDTKLTMERT